MSIIRQPHRRNYTVLPNAALRDPSISFRATGLLAYLLSLPEGASVDSRRLSERKREGRDAVHTAFRELVDAGYALRTKEQNAAGQWVTYTDVFDEPQTGSQVAAPGEPSPGNPAPVGSALIDQVRDVSNEGEADSSDVPWLGFDENAERARQLAERYRAPGGVAGGPPESNPPTEEG